MKGVTSLVWERLTPIHGSRAFAGEVGVIVLGVLIALGAQQLAEDWNDRQKLRESDRALALELGEAAGQSFVKVQEGACVERRLDRIAELVDRAAETGRLPPVGEMRVPRPFTWPSGAWTSIQSGDVAAMEDRERLQGLSGIYSFIAMLDNEQHQSLLNWTTLSTLVGPGRPFSQDDARDMRAAISNARFMDRSVYLHSLRVLQLLNAYGIAVDRPSFEMYTGSNARLTRGDACDTSFGAVPPHYGSAPLRAVVERARSQPVTKPKR